MSTLRTAPRGGWKWCDAHDRSPKGSVLDEVNLRELQRSPDALGHLLRRGGGAGEGDGALRHLQPHLHSVRPDELLNPTAADAEAASNLTPRQSLPQQFSYLVRAFLWHRVGDAMKCTRVQVTAILLTCSGQTPRLPSSASSA